MANRKKLEAHKFTAVVQIRVTPDLKAKLDAIAEKTGVSTSERGRKCLEAEVKTWKAQND